MPFALQHDYMVDVNLVLVFLSLLLQSIIIIDKLTIMYNPYMPHNHLFVFRVSIYFQFLSCITMSCATYIHTPITLSAYRPKEYAGSKSH